MKKSCPISAHDNSQTLHDKLAELGAQAIVEALRLLETNDLVPAPQDPALATYASKLSKTEAQIDWTADATHIANAVRAFNPFPVANSILNSTPIKIWQASVGAELSEIPGTVLSAGKHGIVVACGQGTLNLEVLQRPNAKMLPAEQFLHGFAVHPGDRFTCP